MITYHPETNVLEAARQRISYIFDRLLDIVTTVNGKEEVVEKGIEIAPVEGLHGIVIFFICLTLP